MSTSCYLCGSSPGHSYDCPKYISPVAATQKISPIVAHDQYSTFTNPHWGETWRIYKIIPLSEKIPEWATHGWILDRFTSSDNGTSDGKATLMELAERWASTTAFNPWPLSSRGLKPGDVYTGGGQLSVFGLVKK